MKKNNEKVILSKGFYNRPQKSGRMQVKQYIIIRENNKKCLLLRFFNESELTVSGMKITLTKLGSDSKAREDVEVNIDGINVRPGETYTTTKAIVLGDNCVDFIVDVKSIISAGYEYSDVKGRLVPRYDPRPYARSKSNQYGKASVKRVMASTSKLAACTAFVLVAAIAGIFIYISLRKFGNTGAAWTFFGP